MTVESSVSRVEYDGDGLTTVFSVPFKFSSNDELLVTHRAEYATGATSPTETTLTITTDYTVAGAGGTSGTLTLANPLATSDTPARLVISRNMDFKNLVDYDNNDPFDAGVTNDAYDKFTMQDQQLKEQLGRTVRWPISTSAAFQTELPDPAGNAGKIVGVNATNDGLIYLEYPTAGSAVLTTQALGNDHSDTSQQWSDSSGFGIVSGGFRMYLASNTYDSYRFDPNTFRIRGHDTLAVIRGRRTVSTAGSGISNGNTILQVNADGEIVTSGSNTAERVFGRLEAYAVETTQATMEGAWRVKVTTAYTSDEVEQTALTVTKDTAEFNTKPTASSGLAEPTGAKDYYTGEAVDTKIAAGVGQIYDVPFAFAGTLTNGTLKIEGLPRDVRFSQINYKLGSGTCTIDARINSTSVTGHNAVAVTSTLQKIATTTNRDASEDDRLEVVVTSASSASDLSVFWKGSLL